MTWIIYFVLPLLLSGVSIVQGAIEKIQSESEAAISKNMADMFVLFLWENGIFTKL